MDNLNTGRQSLLLELTRDIIQNTNAGFDDSSIKFKIDKYIELLAQAKVNIKKLSNEEQEELVDLHKFFYGTEFNLEKPLETDSGISTNIFQEFSKAFTIIHKLVTETDELNEKLNPLSHHLYIHCRSKSLHNSFQFLLFFLLLFFRDCCTTMHYRVRLPHKR